jgi:hypothetical protein
VPIALQMKLVDITWSVEPTTIQDKYEIELQNKGDVANINNI